MSVAGEQSHAWEGGPGRQWLEHERSTAVTACLIDPTTAAADVEWEQ